MPDNKNIVYIFYVLPSDIGHPIDEPDMFLLPVITKIIKPHQIGGTRFLFDVTVESLEKFNTCEGSGCILAHEMGKYKND